MQKKNKCKCGSSEVVYVIQKGRSKKIEAFCENCLPVETVEDKNLHEDSQYQDLQALSKPHGKIIK